MDTSATPGKAGTADQCELANDPGSDKAAPLHVQARYDVPPIAFYGALTAQPAKHATVAPTAEPAGVTCLYPVLDAGDGVETAEMAVDTSAMLHYLAYLLIA
jgi:hypothetical protein